MQRIIAVEGIDGSGKTTISRAIAVHLIKLGYKVVLTHEPFDERVVELIESTKWKDPIALALLFSADRALHLRKVSELNADFYVFDRYYCSTLAYQGALGVDLEWLRAMSSKFPKPWLTFVLDLDVETALKRLKRDTLAYSAKYESLKRVRDLYLRIAKECNAVVINANRQLSEVMKDVISYLESRLLFS